MLLVGVMWYEVVVAFKIVVMLLLPNHWYVRPSTLTKPAHAKSYVYGQWAQMLSTKLNGYLHVDSRM